MLEYDRFVAPNAVGKRDVPRQLDTADGRWIVEPDVSGSAGAHENLHRPDRITVLEIEGEGEVRFALSRVEHAGGFMATHAVRRIARQVPVGDEPCVLAGHVCLQGGGAGPRPGTSCRST